LQTMCRIATLTVLLECGVRVVEETFVLRVPEPDVYTLTCVTERSPEFWCDYTGGCYWCPVIYALENEPAGFKTVVKRSRGAGPVLYTYARRDRISDLVQVFESIFARRKFTLQLGSQAATAKVSLSGEGDRRVVWR
jgi:hypothetical protein